MAKFTHDQVVAIRAEYRRDADITLVALAKKYDCDPRTISNLLTGKCFRNVPGVVPVRNPLGGGRKPATPKWKLDRMEELADLGWNGVQIARELGVATSHVYNVLNGDYNYLKA